MRAGCQAREVHGVERRGRRVLQQGVGLWCIGLRTAAQRGQYKGCILTSAVCLPHDGAARAGVCCDDLAREFYRAAGGRCRDVSPEAECYERARAEFEEGSSGHFMHDFLLSLSY